MKAFVVFLMLFGVSVTFAQAGDGQLLYTGWLMSNLSAEVFTLDLASGEATNLTNNSGVDTAPAWSPDGSQIVFVSDRGDTEDDIYFDYGIYVMDSDGSNARLLVDNINYEVEPAWSPDGRWIAYAADQVQDDGEWSCIIGVISADNSDQHQLGSVPYCSYIVEWSPDGQSLVTTSGSTVHILSPNEDESMEFEVNGAEIYAPQWSPDGNTFAYSDNGDIFTIGVNGSELRQLRETIDLEYAPNWTVDGTQIIFLEELSRNNDFAIMNRDGSDARGITLDNLYKYSPVLSPDGTQLAFVGDEDNISGDSAIYIIDLTDGDPVAVTAVGDYHTLNYVSWRLDS